MTTGSVFDAIVKKALPDARVVYINSSGDMIAALESGRIDAFAVDEPAALQISAENGRVAVADGHMDTSEYAFVLPRSDAGEALRAELDEWLISMRESGGLDEVLEKWVNGSDADRTVPDYKSFPATRGTLTLATEGDYAPLNYFRGSDIVGMEIDLAAWFCEACGYGLRIETMSFDGILPAVQAGKVDFAAAGISITGERRESVDFSVPYYAGGTVLVVLKDENSPAQGGTGRQYESLAELEDKRIGVTTGSVQAIQVEERLPNARRYYFDTTVDMLNALRAHKIDAFADAGALVRYIMAENPDLTCLDETLGEPMQVGAIFPKTDAGQSLCGEYNAFLREIRQNGVYDEIQEAWLGEDGSNRDIPDPDRLLAANGTLQMVMCDTVVPFVFIKDGKPAGMDIDIAVRFCRARGYGLKIIHVDFSGIMPTIVSGKADFACGGLAYTPERAQSVLYSDSTFEGASVIAVLRTKKTAQAAESGPSFWDGIASSFEKTFIREDRWKLFVKGVTNTLIITLLAILSGTLAGFAVFLLCRNGNRAANLITRFCLWLVQGMPMVVLLMILYYVVFGSVAINGLIVAVIGFTLTFGASVFGMLKMGVGAVDAGQYEAAYALGYSNSRTFLRIILPQALPHVLPAYRGELVSLLKATAVVGYIAVQDLTKMGDIVRSRTYEAFFPLIAVTVIYFLLEGILGLIVNGITFNLDTRQRKPEKILKGIRTEELNEEEE